MGWKKLEVSVPDLNLGSLADIIDKIKGYLEALVNVLEAILTFIATLTDPLTSLIRALIDRLRKIVESFLEDLGGYVLYVPIRKRLMTNFLGLGDITPNWAGELGIFGGPESQVAYDDPGLNEFIANSNRYNGGNAGFFKTVIESLYDEGDVNRPQFLEEEDYVGGIVLVMGTDFDPLGFLDDIWVFIGMFDGPDMLPKVPRPKNLKGRTIEGISVGSFQRTQSITFSTLLTWDTVEVPVHTLTDLGGILLYPDRYAIIRGRNTLGALSAGSVIDLMGKRDLATGDTFASGDMEVVLEDEYDFTRVSYIDQDVAANQDDTFYYAVAWKLKAYNAGEAIVEGTGTDIDYWHISNVIRVTPFPTLPASTPPDWYRTPSIASLFPQFAALLRKMVAQIEAFAAKLLAPADALKAYVEFLKREILRYERIVNDLLDALKQLIAKLQSPTAGVYSRVFKGKGGNNFFITDLAKSLLPGEPDHPPFDAGDEYVTGVVLMAGGDEILVDGFIGGLSWIFGNASSDESTEMLEQLGEAVNEVEEFYFGSDMEQQDAATPVVEFDEAMVPTSCSGISDVAATFGPNMERTDADV